MFNSSALTVDECVCKAHFDISLWISQLLDREKVCITDEDEDYIQDVSPPLGLPSGPCLARACCAQA